MATSPQWQCHKSVSQLPKQPPDNCQLINGGCLVNTKPHFVLWKVKKLGLYNRTMCCWCCICCTRNKAGIVLHRFPPYNNHFSTTTAFTCPQGGNCGAVQLYWLWFSVFQADTPSDTHSLHITLSTYQKNSWTDFMEKVISITITYCWFTLVERADSC